MNTQQQPKPKTVAIIEARMTSSRLPGKHMLPVNGRPIIEYLIMRLKSVPSLDAIVMATTVNDTDQQLVDLAKQTGIEYFCGSEGDVMGRVIGAAQSVDAEIIVGITGDCPLIDPLIIEQTIQTFFHNKCDYVNNAFTPGYPGGMNTQVYALPTLIRSSELSDDPLDREHVTSHISRNPDLFPAVYLVPPPDLYWPDLILELDEPDDYQLLKKIIEHFGDQNPCFSCGQVIDLLKAHPDWLESNIAVSRKGFE